MMRGNVKALVEKYANDIVKEMLAERLVGIKDFRTSLRPRHVSARTAVIKRLHDEGFSCYAIARILKMDVQTAESRFNPLVGERKRVGSAMRRQVKREEARP